MGRGSAGRSRSGSVTVVRFAFPQLSSVCHLEQKFTKAFLFEKQPIDNKNINQEELKQKKKKKKLRIVPLLRNL